ncbi:MAG: dihydroorotase [Halofilum sp. (in: g-proteobacteria)]|nr:dihydroorotase [Halofilum sp. (in: g-proteobacteria)]
MSALRIEGGRVIDPAGGVDGVHDVWIDGGRIAAVGKAPAGFPEHETIGAAGLVVCPGLVDLCARLREPGEGHKGGIGPETRAAVAGGVTTLCQPPDTRPAIDTPATVELIHQRALAADRARVLPVGALTVGLAGEYLAPMRALAAAGCVALGQAERPLRDTHVLRQALAYAATHGLTVMLPLHDPDLAHGCAHEGPVATRLGLPGIPVAAETTALARIAALAADTGARIHVGRVSSAAACEQLARARDAGLALTADVAAHQLHLTQEAVLSLDPRTHVRPPLRDESDRMALRRAVGDGLLAVCSDHQPHEADAKRAPFGASAPGISALETLLPLALAPARDGDYDLATALRALTAAPAAALGLEAGTLAPGAAADVLAFDPDAEWTLDPAAMLSRGHNTPFAGSSLRGRVAWTLVGGRRVWPEA